MRIDVFLTDNRFCTSRSRAQELIRQGAVRVNGRIVTKPSLQVEGKETIECDPSGICPYVSRGGLKLEAALDRFSVSPEGLVCADIGASTGGFTDCLLAKGARKVYAIDVGTAQLDERLRRDPRVISLEKCNAKYLNEETTGEKCPLVVMDVSFISQTRLFPAVMRLLPEGGTMITLVKPQFEVGRSGVGKGGIVRDPRRRHEALAAVVEAAEGQGFSCRGTMVSPITGADGNEEYLACFRFGGKEEDKP